MKCGRYALCVVPVIFPALIALSCKREHFTKLATFTLKYEYSVLYVTTFYLYSHNTLQSQI